MGKLQTLLQPLERRGRLFQTCQGSKSTHHRLAEECFCEPLGCSVFYVVDKAYARTSWKECILKKWDRMMSMCIGNAFKAGKDGAV